MIKGISKVKYEPFFKLEQIGRTRGHNYKLVKNRARLDTWKNYFSHRILSQWNKLPKSVVEAETVNSF